MPPLFWGGIRLLKKYVYLTFRRTPGEGSPHFDRFDGQNFTFPALSEGIGMFRPLRRSTKDAVFGNCKPFRNFPNL